MALAHLSRGDVSNIFDDLHWQIPNMLIFMDVQADDEINSWKYIWYINTLQKSFFVRTKKACTIVIEDNLSIGMVQAEIAENFETVTQCISGVGPFQREETFTEFILKSSF